MRGTVLTGAICIVIVWVVATIAAFWYFEGQYLRPVPRPAGVRTLPVNSIVVKGPSILTDQGQLPLGSGQPITLLNFWNPDCGCSRYTETHVQKLMQTYGLRGVRIVTVIVSSRHMDRETAMSVWRSRHMPSYPVTFDSQGTLARTFGVWAAPAAVILDRNGYVSYVGAYNAARYCDDKHTAWAQQALDATLVGQTPRNRRTLFFGCKILR